MYLYYFRTNRLPEPRDRQTLALLAWTPPEKLLDAKPLSAQYLWQYWVNIR